MAQQEVDLIKAIFSSLKVNAHFEVHEEVRTSEEAAQVRGVELGSGIKALLFTNGEGLDNSWVIVDVPADKKVDTKKVADKLSWSKGKTRMATPEEVEVQTGCIIGAVPPFGHRKKIPLLVDMGVYSFKENNFNIGLRTHSARVKSKDLRVVFDKLKGMEGRYTKD